MFCAARTDLLTVVAPADAVGEQPGTKLAGTTSHGVRLVSDSHMSEERCHPLYL